MVHRLDRPTTGVVLFAKTSKALARLNTMFANKQEVQKTYWALVDAKPPVEEDKLTHWLVRNEKQNKSVAYNKEMQQSKKAVLHYKLLKSYERYYLLEIDLITGRHHQIRAQLAAIGLHIKGDLKYGAKRSNPDGGICLHAYSLSFVHPVKKEPIKIIAKAPFSFL
ncbi:RNA pseudouridine synthase [Capnocytophaga sp. oral taxon 412 str. F0487]|nr:RNA pseudouridine synthase [Capnocytophaga sp. oral taxon 412 str. F0487]